MKIDNTECLMRKIYTGYEVKPFKYFGHISYQTDEEKDAEFWGVLTICDEFEQRKIAEFKEQDEAHQFAELLTICLNQIKAFQNEQR